MKEMEAKTENRYEYRKPQEKRKQMIAPDLFEFAYVPDWYGHLAELERLALPESWKFRKPSRETKNTDTPILERYIHTIFRKVWQCSERYKVKGVMGCANRHVEEETLVKAYLMAWNALVENREDFMEQWTEQLQSENLLEGYRAEKFIEYTDRAEPLTEMDTDFMLENTGPHQGF